MTVAVSLLRSKEILKYYHMYTNFYDFKIGTINFSISVGVTVILGTIAV